MSVSLESLCYHLDPTKLGGFFDFFLNGKRDASGNYETDSLGRRKVGVINWLVGTIQCANVHFFSTNVPVPTIVVTLPNRRVPWLDIAGFMDFVASGTQTLQLGEGQFLLDQRTDLEAALAAACSRFDSLFHGIDDEKRQHLEAALRGEAGTDLDAILKTQKARPPR